MATAGSRPAPSAWSACTRAPIWTASTSRTPPRRSSWCAAVDRCARAGGRWKTVTVYAIISLTGFDADPSLLAGWIRGHWGIENRLHWVPDVTYDEDRSTFRTGHAPQVMAAFRNLAITTLRLSGAKNIAAALRPHARDTLRPVNTYKIT